MRMVLVAPFAIKRCRLKKPVLGRQKDFLRPFRSSDLSRFLNRQKAAQKPPGVRKTRKEHLPSWRRATARVCKQTVPGARIPVRALSFSRFSQSRKSLLYAQKSFPHSRSLRRKNPEGRSAPRTGGSIGPILLRPFSVAALRIPQRTTCGWFWWHLLPPKGAGPA